ncbi:Gfo/Idh/MocA family protein [Paenibacillus koleovorans]|uniref:Gfo/Idh/MocA family protein n=1 Tax=Paenibacillus koleovorans TaxID=121608 RepID=UPI000FDA4B75|nr:Gfo/Idh/MocA family oxidoreductase [Paenibacillus koleovorans]
MRKLRTGVVGLGRIGWRFHLPEIAKEEGFELAAVADPSNERLAEAKAEYGVQAYADYEAMLKKERLDLVVIASPTMFHTEQTIMAFQYGADVLLEKPMAATLPEADRMIEAMHNHGRKLMVYQPHRTTAAYQAAKSIIDGGLLGPIYMLKKSISRYTRRNDWQAFTKFGGGMLNNYGAHAIDELISLAGPNVKRIDAHLRKIASLGDADDVVKAVLETESGVVLDIDINMAIAAHLPEWVILGERGTAIIEGVDDQQVFKLKYYLPEELKELAVHDGLAAPGREYRNFDEIPWRQEVVRLADFKPIPFYEKCYEHYALNEPPFIPIEQTREVMRVTAECRKEQ